MTLWNTTGHFFAVAEKDMQRDHYKRTLPAKEECLLSALALNLKRMVKVLETPLSLDCLRPNLKWF
jgi:hypothetical protein